MNSQQQQKFSKSLLSQSIIVQNDRHRRVQINKKKEFVKLSNKPITNKEAVSYTNTTSKLVQLRKKLGKIDSVQELQKIYKLSKSQNQQLQKDLTVLRQHLQKVESNKNEKNKLKYNKVTTNNTTNSTVSVSIKDNIKNTQSHSQYSNNKQGQKTQQQQFNQMNDPIQKQLKGLQQQLSQQYKLMDFLKGNINNLQQQLPTNQLNEQKLTLKNKLKQLTTLAQKETKTKLTLQKENQHLEQTINKQLYSLKQNENQHKITQLAEENKLLRKEILKFKQETYKHEAVAAKVIDSIYSKKEMLGLRGENGNNIDGNDVSKVPNREIIKKRAQSLSNLHGDTVNSNEKNNNKVNSKLKQLTDAKMNDKITAITQVKINDKNYQTSLSNQFMNRKDAQKLSALTLLSFSTGNHCQQQAQQINTLKTKVNQLSMAALKQKQIIKKEKQLLKQSNSKLNQNYLEQQKTKTKKINELNHLKSTLKNIIQNLQLKKQLKFKIQHKEVQTQVEFGYSNWQMGANNGCNSNGNQTNVGNISSNIIVHNKNNINNNNIKINQSPFYDLIQPLRRDFAGILGSKHRFDDRLFLKQKYRSFIKGIIVYENDNNLSIKGSIAAIRAIYTDQFTNQMNFVPLPGSYLQKCKIQRLQLPEDDFIKLIKVKYNNKQTRVSKIQVRSNRNQKYEFGEKRPFQQVSANESVYAFDIGLNEVPVGVYGSYLNVKNCWYLQSLGVEINTLS